MTSMKLGEKIRLLREIKGITTKDMSAELDMSLAGYLKIERDEVNVNMEKVEKIASKLGMKPHELLMDEKIVLHFSNNSNNDHGNFGVFNTVNFPDDLRKLYEDKIKLLEEKNSLLLDKIQTLTEDNKRYKEEADILKSKIK